MSNIAENVAVGLEPEGDLENAIRSVASQIRCLGNGNAATEMGAIEAHGKFTSEALKEIAESISGLNLETESERLAHSIDGLTNEVSSGLSQVADAVEHLAKAIREAKR